jgi:SAM-dependent methyltransferase
MTEEDLSLPRLYDEFAPWWRLMSDPSEYAEEAAFYRTALQSGVEGSLNDVLELGSGGGNNASHMKRWFRMTLVDLADGMLAQSREINPECGHVRGDMREVRLGRTFDGVFVHDAIAYMTSEKDLKAVFETAYLHCRPGGAALFAPDHVRETFRPSTDCGGHDSGGQGMRYMEWSWDPDPEDTTCLVDYVYAFRAADGSVRVEHDRHLEGIFPRRTWLKLLREVGFAAESLPFDHSELPAASLEVFLARRPA